MSQKLGAVLGLTLLAWVPVTALAADIPAGVQEYFVLGNESNTQRVFSAVASAEGKGLGKDASTIESVITLAATTDGQVIFYDHWEDGFDDDPLIHRSATTEKYVLAAGQALTLKSTSDASAGVPTSPRGTALRYDGGDRILSVGGTVNLVHFMWPSGVVYIADAWEIHPLQALRNAYAYTIPIGEDTYQASGGDAGPYGGFKHVYLEVQALHDNTQISLANGTDSEVILILDRGQSYSTLGYVDGVAKSGTAREIFAGTTLLASEPIQVGTLTFGKGEYQSRFFNSIPDSLYGTDFVTQTHGTDDPTQFYVFNPSPLPITVTAFDTSTLGGGDFVVPAQRTVAYTTAMGHSLPSLSGVRMVSDDLFYVLGAYDYRSTSFDWGYTPVPSYYLGTEISVPWAPGYLCDGWCKAGNYLPVWVAPLMDNTKIRIDRDGDGAWDLIDLDADGKADPTDDPAGIDRYYLADVLHPLRIYDQVDMDATGMRIVADKPISAAYGEYEDKGQVTSAPDWGYTLLPVIRPWLDEVFAVEVTVNTRSIPSGGGSFVPTFTMFVNASDPVTAPLLKVTLPPNTTFTSGTGAVVLGDGTLVPLEPTVGSGVLTFNLASLVPALSPGDRVKVQFAAYMASAAPRGQSELRGVATGWWSGLQIKPSTKLKLFKGALAVHKYATAQTTQAGAAYDYVISVVNIDATAVNGVTIEDMLPPDVNLVFCGTCQYDQVSRTAQWAIGLLLPGEARTVSFTVGVKNTKDALTISNEAFAYDDTGDLAYSNPWLVNIVGPLVSIHKSVSQANVQGGETLTYAIHVTNTGSRAALSARVSDLLPAGITYVPGSLQLTTSDGTLTLGDGANDDGAIEGAYDSGSRTISLLLPTIVSAEEFTLRFSATVATGLAAGTRINNAAMLLAQNVRLTRSQYAVVEVGNQDTDCDGLTDAEELNAGTDPDDADTDADGIADGTESGITLANTNSACTAFTPDADTATQTNPVRADSDGDGLPDGFEDTNANGRVDAGELNPNSADSEGDGLSDYLEVVVGSYGNGKTNPLSADTDSDGLADGVEDANANGQVDAGETDPTLADTDGDGLPDGSDPEATNPDADGDGLPDGSDPNPLNPDADGDALSDYVEVVLGNYGNGKTDPLNPDSDGDGLADGAEDTNANGQVDAGETDPTMGDTDDDGLPDGSDPGPTSADADGDGLPDYVEVVLGNYGNGKTDPLNADTDGDGLRDGAEDANANGMVDAGETDPTLADTDGDGVPDNTDTNPTNPDSDGDGITDGQEDLDGDGVVDPGETDPNNADTDGDGLSDYLEIFVGNYGNGKTDPRNPDTDGDTLLDGAEDANHSGGVDAGESDPTRADTDGDGIPDNLDPNAGDPDSDDDGLPDGQEDANHNGEVDPGETNPLSADSDGDGLSDYLEIVVGSYGNGKTDPLDADSDGDSLLDGAEDANHNGSTDAGETDPTLADTDGDGILDNFDPNPGDADSDDDGLGDGQEDTNHNGVVDSGETNPRSADSDGDGLSDYIEVVVGSYSNGKTDPLNPDSDGDLLPDGVEDANHDGDVDAGETDPTSVDTDGDGIADTVDPNPADADSDDDGLLDGEEDINLNGKLDAGETNPLNPDTDGDLLNDYVEVVVGSYGNGKTNPRNADTDGDALLDGAEDVNANGRVDPGETDPTLADSDGDGVPDNADASPGDADADDDGLTDGEEDRNGNGVVDPGETDPNTADSDGDGLLDGTEVGSAYGNGSTDPLNPDSDGDGLSDGVEDVNKNGLREASETDPTAGDTDHDGLTDLMETSFVYGRGLKTSPVIADTDGDGLLDGVEDGDHDGQVALTETDPTIADMDDDNLLDGQERNSCYTHCNKTNPRNADTDGDGLLDSSEDRNRNGRLDAGETDPTLADSDGDGVLDGATKQPVTRQVATNQELFGDEDTDGGGVIDRLEREAGTDIYDPSDDYLAREGEVSARGGGGCASAGAGRFDGGWFMVLGALGFLRRRRWLGPALAGFVAAQAVSAHAGTPDAQTFKPNVDGKGMVMVEGARTLNEGKWSAGLFLNYVKDPLIAVTPTGRELDPIVERAVGADLVGAFGVTQYLSVGAAVPITLNQRALRGEAQSWGFNDFSLWSKGAILTEEGGPLSLSGVLRINFPTGKDDEFLGDGKWGGELGAIAERHVSIVRLTGSVGYHLRNDDVTYLNLDYRDELTYGLGAAVPENTREYALEFFGSTPADDAFSYATSPLEAVLSFKQKVIEAVQVEAGVGRGITDGYGSPTFRAFTGVRYSTDAPPAPPVRVTDLDGDGILDTADACIAQPEDFDAFKDEDGCPEADNDNDKLADNIDKCPNQAEDFDEYEDADGCPEDRFWSSLHFMVVNGEKKPIPMADVQLIEGGEVRFRAKSDVTGAVEARVPSGTYVMKAGAADFEPIESAVFATRADHRYTLTLRATATLGFIVTSVRNMAGEPIDATVAIRPSGLKLAATRDQATMQTSLAPGKYQIVATAKGFETAMHDVELAAGRTVEAAFKLKALPKVQTKAVLKDEKIEITEQVRFVTGKSTIVESSYGLLDDVAKVLKANPKVKVRIEGHTDNVGKPVKNLKLSEKRAIAVRDYLLARGVSGKQLQPVGYGDGKPVADNSTESGRTLNRRVEFMVQN